MHDLSTRSRPIAEADEKLPIDEVLDDLVKACRQSGQAVLQAPPGAGKTTKVPLALIEVGIVEGRILMLEPRRLATRAAARRMADMLGEELGDTVGYRIRGEGKTGKATRIEVVTEGVLTRMIQSDPELTGVGMVIFDEFHERSLQADLGLALCLEIRDALRKNLKILVMSATLDAEPVAKLMGSAPIITSKGQSFPVTTRWLQKPWKQAHQKGPPLHVALAELVKQAVQETKGGILVFLPGEGEIRRLESELRKSLPAECLVQPLFGAMPFKDQQKVIAPVTVGRKIVLATSIAETSLTIDGIHVVVDSGQSRRARFDPGSGMSRLVTERTSKAEAAQRRGRAGRLAPGICYRLWTKGEEGGLPLFPPAEIESSDLTSLVLECAVWGGVADPHTMPFLTQPNKNAVAECQRLLRALGAIDDLGAVTTHGRAMANLPLHPRLAHMVLKGGKDAPLLGLILSERDVLKGNGGRPPADLSLRWAAVQDPGKFVHERPFGIHRARIERIRAELKKLHRGRGQPLKPGAMAALAYPDRIGLHRKGDAPRFVLSGGKGAVLDQEDPLASSRLIVATDLDGDTREARVRTAVTLAEGDLRELYSDQIVTQKTCAWSQREQRVLALIQEKFGALVLSEQNWKNCPEQEIAAAMADGVRDLGIPALPFNTTARLLLARLEWLRKHGANLPDYSSAGLLDDLSNWLQPILGKCRRKGDLKTLDLTSALRSRLDWQQQQLLEELAPASITAPTGTKLAVDYSGERPMVSVRLQEMFGLTEHPLIGPEKHPLLLELLSPAQRPVQLTSDLQGFWRDSYHDVRKDMRGRYPKHPWPDDPTRAEATRRRKPKGS